MSSDPAAGTAATRLAAGKPPLATLARLLGSGATADPRVIVGPRVGEDAAVIDLGDRYLVATADPVTFVADDIGWYAVHVNANDLAVRGARPAWFLMTLLLPEGADEALLERIFGQVREACGAVGATLVGGHTEITRGLDRPVLCGAMLGEAAKDGLVTTGAARPGDAVLVSKGIAVEGTSILARELATLLTARGIPPEVLARARGFLRSPGISVLHDAELARAAAPVHAMHDPTEGGLATGLLELALAGEVGLRIQRGAIPVLPECAHLCRALGLDALGLIASGCLLLTCPPGAAEAILAAWGAAGIAGAVIGQVVPRDAGCVLVEAADERPLPSFPRDEVARLFDQIGATAS
jgi:hydrogenase maturation factor